MNRRKWSLSFRHWATLLIAIVLVTMVSFQYILNFNFTREMQTKYSEKTLKLITSNMTTMMMFPLSISDKQEIARIVEDLIKLDEVYAIEVRSNDSEMIYRGEDSAIPINKGIPIIKETINIYDTRKPINQNLLFDPETKNRKPLGKVSIYLTTAKSDRELMAAIYFRLAVFVSIASALGFIIFLFSRSTHRYVERLRQSMAKVAAGQYDIVQPTWRISEWNQIAEGLNELSKELETSIDAIKCSEKEATQALITAEQADKFKSDFIRIFCHEIRTPANTISSLIDLIYFKLLNEKISPTLKNHFDVCYSASQELNSVIDELLDFFQLERDGSTKLVVNQTAFSPMALFKDAYTQNKASFEQKGLMFSVNMKGSEFVLNDSQTIISDKGKLARILSNLIKNAYKFTDKGSVQVTWEIVIFKSSEALHFEVSDSGQGIPEDKINDIFEKFYQVESPITRSTGGWGLGLAITKHFVNALQGKITVESIVGEGSTFSVSIPVDIPTNSLTTHSEFRSSINPELSIIVVDDNESNCYALTQTLLNLDIQVVRETNPLIALDNINKNLFDIIIVDYHMPELDGLSFIDRVKESKVNGNTAIICISADTHRETKRAIEESKIDGFISKPIKKEELYQLIDTINKTREAIKSIPR